MSFFHLRSVDADLMGLLKGLGHMPLPPYITREDNEADRQRYQTVFAETPGAVAAPTAGLHFDRVLLDQLERCGYSIHHGHIACRCRDFPAGAGGQY